MAPVRRERVAVRQETAEPQTELPGRLPWTEANGTKGSPTRWRFRPPSPLTFRLQPCGGPRSALGKGFNLVALRGRRTNDITPPIPGASTSSGHELQPAAGTTRAGSPRSLPCAPGLSQTAGSTTCCWSHVTVLLTGRRACAIPQHERAFGVRLTV